MKRSRAVYEQRFHVRHTEIAIGYPEGSVSIACSNLSKSCMKKLMNELVYDGYSAQEACRKIRFTCMSQTL